MHLTADQYYLLYERDYLVNEIKSYLLSVCASAILCAIITKLTEQKGSIAALTKLLCGIYMMITILSPVISLPIKDYMMYFDQIAHEAECIAASGADDASREINISMQQCTQAYIQERARQLGTELDIDVVIHEGKPCSVYLNGAVSPYVKQQLSAYICDQLGIAKEDQWWNR